MIRAALFDMDGLLIDSEPLWQEAEIAVFATLGQQLTRDDCRQTMGRRVDEVVQYWYDRQPWPGPDVPTVATRIVDEVVRLIHQRGTAMPGVAHAIQLCQYLGLRLAVASSSYERLIHVVVTHLGLDAHFALLYSAQHEPQGKPHPGVFLTAAAQLGVAPAECVVLEDSPNGVRAALAAGMRCIAVPDAGVHQDPVFAQAHVRLTSLMDLTEVHILG